jgi:hypothetical protein
LTPRICAAIAIIICISAVFGWAYSSSGNWQWQEQTVRAGLRATGIAIAIAGFVATMEWLNVRRRSCLPALQGEKEEPVSPRY